MRERTARRPAAEATPGPKASGSRSSFLALALAGGLIVAGALSFPGLAIQASPRASFPELTVSYAAPPADSPVDTGRIALGPDSPLLRSIRALGGVTGIAGEARTGGAEIHVRFAAGTDPETKALRLSRALAARGPSIGAYSVRAGTRAEGELAAVLWLGSLDDPASRSLAEELRALPGVRAVDRHGGTSEQTRYRLPQPPGREADAIRRRVARSLEAVPLGRARGGAGGAVAVRVETGGGDPSGLVLPGGFRLGTLAERRTYREPLPAQTHLRGRPGRALWIWRESDAPPLRLSRDLHRKLEELALPPETRLLLDEAAPLRRQLGRLAAGLFLAATLLGLGGRRLGGWRGGAAGFLLPLAAAAAALLTLRAFATPLDPASLTALPVATGAATLAGLLATRLRGAARRRFLGMAAASCLSLPLAAWLGASLVPPLLAASCRVFGIAAGAGMVAGALLARLGGSGSRHGGEPRTGPPKAEARGGRTGRALRLVLRDPATALLAAGSAGFLLFVFFGGALAPGASGTSPGTAGWDLTLAIDSPAGATLRETEAQVARIERELDRLGGEPRIAEHWSDFDASRARIEIRLTPEARSAAERERLVAELRLRLPGGEAMRVEGGSDSGGELSLGDEIEERAESDREAESYRALLHAADVETLRRATGSVRVRLRELKVPLRSIDLDEPLPSTYLDLSPHSGGAAGLAAGVASGLAERSAPPAPFRLPGPAERTVAVVPAGVPTDPERVPQRAALLGRVLELPDPRSGAPLAVVPSALFRVRERSAPSRAAWQAGRFIQPITLDLRETPSLEGREKRRRELDEAFASLRLPAGSHLERPDLSWLRLRRTELRRTLLLLLLPLLWVAAATVRLDSLRSALLLLGPAALGATAAAPVVWAAAAGGEGAGEATLFALAASLAATLPLAAWSAGAIEDRGGRPGARAGAYRELRLLAPLAFLGLAGVVALALVPTLGADPSREAWVVPLRAAAAAGGVSAAAFLLLPALLFAPARKAREGVRGHRPSGAALAAVDLPAAPGEGALTSPAPRTLAVENLTKVYRNGGRALHRVSFELRPGIVGLLGPNGAGKTTLLRCLVGLLEPTRGRVLVGERPLATLDRAAYRRGVGFLPQDFNAYPGFTAERFLAYWAAARDLPAGPAREEEIGRLLEAVHLSGHARRKVRDFSGGMRRRLGIAASLLGAPPILIVDEPTTGLDIESRARFRETLLAVASERIVLLSTHIASDVEAIASRLLVLSQGRLVFDGAPASLIAQARGAVFERLIPDSELRDLSHRYQLTSRVRLLAGIRVRGVVKPGEPLPGAAVEPTLEEAYLVGQTAANGRKA